MIKNTDDFHLFIEAYLRGEIPEPEPWQVALMDFLAPTWDILICSIWHRSEMLVEILRELERQITDSEQAGVGVIVFRDNLQYAYGEKCQALLNASKARYVSFLDDDDWISSNFIDRICEAIQPKFRDSALFSPDYVGFKVRYTVDDVEQMPVTHSLSYSQWENREDRLERDIVHFNPIRRELAERAAWAGGNGADERWARELRHQNVVKREVFIDEQMYHYRHRTVDTFMISSKREPMDTCPEVPDFDFVRWLP